ncbi:MAG: hypothetical protein H7269_14110, partial [Cellulomonas sp.]|nr:hypothetical protein [Cellulomonas sp.]
MSPLTKWAGRSLLRPPVGLLALVLALVGPVLVAPGVGTALSARPAMAEVAAVAETDVARASTSPCPTPTTHPWCDPTLDPDVRAGRFQRAMTLEEEITLVGGQGRGAAPHTGDTYAIARLGLRAVYLTDGPVGVRQGSATAMPIPMALA